MGWMDRFKPHKGDVYRPGQCMPEPDFQTATGRKLYTVQQVRAAYAQGAKDSLNLLVRTRNLLSHPPHWQAEEGHADKRHALSAEIAEHLSGMERSEAWTEREKRAG